MRPLRIGRGWTRPLLKPSLPIIEGRVATDICLNIRDEGDKRASGVFGERIEREMNQIAHEEAMKKLRMR